MYINYKIIDCKSTGEAMYLQVNKLKKMMRLHFREDIMDALQNSIQHKWKDFYTNKLRKISEDNQKIYLDFIKQGDYVIF